MLPRLCSLLLGSDSALLTPRLPPAWAFGRLNFLCLYFSPWKNGTGNKLHLTELLRGLDAEQCELRLKMPPAVGSVGVSCDTVTTASLCTLGRVCVHVYTCTWAGLFPH